MFYPAYINLQNRKCLVVGGGTVAERKVVSMLISGAHVTVISPDATELIAYLAKSRTIHWHKRELIEGDTQDYFLVTAATDETSINTSVFSESHDVCNIRLVNVVDVIPQCTFAAASVVTDGEIVISISTSGKSPATSRRIREYLEDMLNTSSLYTLGYENGKPIPIENQLLPYPVYLLLKDRNCVVLYENETSEIERRITLLRKCGADVVCYSPKLVKYQDIKDAFLVISEKHPYLDIPDDTDAEFIYESIDKPNTGTFITPKLLIDDNLIISISVKNGLDHALADSIYDKLRSQFENRGYGDFIDILGRCRSEVLETFPTPNTRKNFLETLIGYVENTSKNEICCLGLGNHACNAECLFNWVRHGKIEHARNFISNQLTSHSPSL